MHQQKSRRSFDEWFSEMLSSAKQLARHVNGTIRAYRLTKVTAWRMATAYVEMVRLDQAKLIDLIRSTHGSRPGAVDAWLEQQFAPLGQLSLDYRELISAVSGGMSQREYLSSAPGLFLARKSRKPGTRSEAGFSADPPPPQSELPVDQQLRIAMDQNRGLRAEVAELRRRNRELQTENARLWDSAERLEREMDRINKLMDLMTAKPV